MLAEGLIPLIARFSSETTFLLKIIIPTVHSVLFPYFRYNHLKQQFDLKSREAELVQDRLKQTTHHHKVEEVKALEQAIGIFSVRFYFGSVKLISDGRSVCCQLPKRLDRDFYGQLVRLQV